MSDNDVYYYILVTPDNGLQIVARQWFDFESHYKGSFIDQEFETEEEAQALADRIWVSVTTKFASYLAR